MATLFELVCAHVPTVLANIITLYAQRETPLIWTYKSGTVTVYQYNTTTEEWIIVTTIEVDFDSSAFTYTVVETTLYSTTVDRELGKITPFSRNIRTGHITEYRSLKLSPDDIEDIHEIKLVVIDRVIYMVLSDLEEFNTNMFELVQFPVPKYNYWELLLSPKACWMSSKPMVIADGKMYFPDIVDDEFEFIEMYDPETGGWTFLPFPPHTHGIAMGTVRNTIYILVKTSESDVSLLQRYENNEWVILDEYYLAAKHNNIRMWGVGDLLYINSVIQYIEVYDTVRDSWGSICTPLTQGDVILSISTEYTTFKYNQDESI